MYVNPDYKSKKEFIAAVKAGTHMFRTIRAGFFQTPKTAT